MNIHIYYHVALIGDRYKEIINCTIKKILDSGLYEASTSINVCLLKQDSRFNIDFARLADYPKFKVIYASNDITEFEYPTLKRLYEHSVAEDGYFLYIHTKGVSRPNKYVDDWRNCMEYFTIEKWKDCVEMLKIYGSVGVNFQYEPYKHYSGNYWWSKSSYLKTLKNPEKTNDRLEHEHWIGSGKNINPCSLYNAGINLYDNPHPKTCYQDISLTRGRIYWNNILLRFSRPVSVIYKQVKKFVN